MRGKRMSKKIDAVLGGITALGIPVFVVLVVLDSTDAIDWPWYWVLAPLWIPLALGIAYGIVKGVVEEFNGI